MKKRRARKWSDDDLRNAVRSSTSLSGVLRCLNLRVAGGNHKSIAYWISEFKLDTSHFRKDGNLDGLVKARAKITLSEEEVLCENSTASRNAVKRWARQLLDNVCSECGNLGVHNGKPLTLQLDHKNGVSNDHRLENLRWLCPNCHTQTETFAGKKSW